MPQTILNPPCLYAAKDIRQNKELVPDTAGLYGWYFRKRPEGAPAGKTDTCHTHDDKMLLYVGIAPSRDSSKATLRSRIVRNHIRGSARNSTLRRTLSLLNGFSFDTEGQAKLNEWLDDNAFVCWLETKNPWEAEKLFLKSTADTKPLALCPLNLAGNQHHSFYPHLKQLRKRL